MSWEHCHKKRRASTGGALPPYPWLDPTLLDSYAIERGIADRHVLEVSDETNSLVMDLVAVCHGGGAPTVPPNGTGRSTPCGQQEYHERG
jgi:hypothetical protein